LVPIITNKVKITRSEIVGFAVFSVFIISILTLWKLQHTGEIQDELKGIVTKIQYINIGRGSYQQAIVKLENGEEVDFICESCSTGNHIVVVKREAGIFGEHTYEKSHRYK